ncbi:RNA polymerase sigma-70 factor (sigma-E family) [Nocardioides sp. BE266]|uniref:SigE family RNA polymerase sigma factor n=1 Tax=Nocardioides sp. BE266 TaxID=2817725 RepID=UPI00285E03D7|nr:SigE family RNA polymerase sigma factor [Nocardioides sp. BE266]MDR7252804.1 RNA polymerase sigma-70 factor (sigma-E family) [Nocardioides sp. BE266]
MRRASDVAAFSEFAEACGPSLFRTAYLMVGDHQLAQDLVQEALVKTLIAWPRLHDRANLAAYTRRIVVTTSVSWRRRRSFHERPSDHLPEPRVAGDPGEEVVTHDAVMHALLAVPPRQRAAIVLRYYEDLTEAQAAEVLGCSVGTVKSQVAAGLKHMRADLGPSFDETLAAGREVTS